MRVVDTLTRAAKAGILRRVAGEDHPKLVLADIAHEHGITVPELQTLLNKHGYPRPESMRRAADLIENPQAVEQAVQSPTPQRDDTLRQVPLHLLRPDPANPREDLGDLTDLGRSLADAGMLQPIIARKHGGGLIVVAGHRRLAAAKALGWESVPVIIRTDMLPDQVLAAMLIENGQRKDLDPIEVGRGIRALQAELGNCSHTVLSRRIGRSQAFISERLALLNLTPEDQALVRKGRFKLTQAIAKGRENSGRVKLGARNGRAPGHFSQNHMLAVKVRARCGALDHSTANSMSVGGSGCGECWEEVIRADERDQFVALASVGPCPVCDSEPATRAVAS